MTLFHYFYPIEVRYSDLDPQGHVNNARYFSLIEQARVGYLMHLGLWDGKSFLDIGVIIAEAQVSYKAPIHYGKVVHIGVRISRLGNKSMTMLYRFQEDHSEFEYANGSTVLVAYDYRNTRTIPISDEWRKKISDFEGIPQYAEG